MENSLIINFDQEEIYCAKLGHFLNFKYCRREQINLPCKNIIFCWKSHLPINELLSNSFHKMNDISSLNNQNPSKISTILNLIETIKDRS